MEPLGDGKFRKRLRVISLYDCAKDCGRKPGSRGDRAARSAMRCSLPGWDPATWDRAADRDAAAEAEERAERLHHIAREQGIELDHDLDRDGCPWGWVVSRWATSVAAYTGTRSAEGARSVNPRMLAALIRGDAPHMLTEWVAAAESFEDAAHSFIARVRQRMG